MRVNYNVSSIIARNAMNNNDRRVSASTQKLSSGYKINKTSDDAAGMAIARKMNAQIKSIQRANRNTNDGLSVVNTADGAMGEMHDILQRMNELAIQSANGTNADMDREQIQKEIDQLIQELDRIANTTQFNAQNLLDGSFALKGYTNTENVRVMSYNEGVPVGTYTIGQLKYSRYEDKITSYTTAQKEIKDPDNDKLLDIEYKTTPDEITHDERYAADSADEVLNNLGRDAGSGITAFPDGAKVLLEDENIVIKAENDFELKITLNDRTPFIQPGQTPSVETMTSGGRVHTIKTTYNKDATGVSTTTVVTYTAVDSYRNLTVETDDGKRYDIKKLNFMYETDFEGTPKGGANSAPDKIYTGNQDDNGRDLREDFAEYFKSEHPDCDIEIENVTYDTGTKEFTISYAWTDARKNGPTVGGNEFTVKLSAEKNELGGMMTPKGLEHYQYMRTQTKQTEYTVGNKAEKDDSITLDLTGMGPMIVQVGANEGQYMEIEIPALDTVSLGVDDLDVTTAESATEAIDIVGKAINRLSGVRAKIGAYANRLEHTITNLDTTEENMTASYSRIMDVDMAAEMTEYSTVQVLVQASTSMLAQANERPQQVLQLLQ